MADRFLQPVREGVARFSRRRAGRWRQEDDTALAQRQFDGDGRAAGAAGDDAPCPREARRVVGEVGVIGELVAHLADERPEGVVVLHRDDLAAAAAPQQRLAVAESGGSGQPAVTVAAGEAGDAVVNDVWIGEADDEPAPRQQAAGLVLAVTQQLAEADGPRAGGAVDHSLAGAGCVLCRGGYYFFDQLRERVRVDDDGVVVEERRRVGEGVVIDRRSGQWDAQRQDAHR